MRAILENQFHGKVTGSAPGRLDFLGGVADYSGSLVLETPIHAATDVTVSPIPGANIELHSHENGQATLDWKPLRDAVKRSANDDELRALLDPGWTRYVIGSLLVLCREKHWLPADGLRFEVCSKVPQSMGVSSSAALEIATLRAVAILAGIRFVGTELAHLGQLAENRLVGAPCGLMDQLTCAFGKPDCLLPILCQPDILRKPVRLPRGVIVVGWPSGVKHDVGASPYATARAAAFMGKKIVERHLRRRIAHAAELTVAEFTSAALPATMTGRAFLKEYGGTDDPLTRVVPGRRYPVRAALRFPVEENDRCERALRWLRVPSEKSLQAAGELLLRSHAGYTSMGLGSAETDTMVEAAMAVPGIYGARVSGGGSGGTVVVLLRKTALPALRRLTRRLNFSSKDAQPLIY